MKFAGIIPARFASTRFPGKPLADICGKPMIRRVYEQAAKALEHVVVATDDARILRAVREFGGNCVMTSESHRSGTDRCYEAAMMFAPDADVVINIQGDEPFVDPSQIEALKECFAQGDTRIATLIREFDPEAGFEALFNPNTPKVVKDSSGNALYFSRSIIPYVRGKEWNEWVTATTFYTHVGMYAYTLPTLAEIVKLPQSPLEIAESLEQLRWLQAGYRIKTAVTGCKTVGIDTPEDLKAAVEMLERKEIEL